ncbi:MAG: SGNH/GDSL hydrolase family protein [Vicinamibacterales bacterium]
MATKLVAFILAAVLTPVLAIAAPITSLYVVGDSLSDQGNGFILTGGAFPPLPYDQRASNGPVAVEYFANALGVPLAASGAGGTNYAVVGAATGLVGTPPFATENVAAILYGQAALEGTSLLSQTGDILGTGPLADPNALFFVWGGANDLFIDPSLATAGNAIDNLAAIISMLYGGGARQFLVPNLPDLSLTPSGTSLPPAQKAGLQLLSIGFNAGLADALNGLSVLPGIDIEQFDTFGLFNAILANPAAFGFSNTSTPCITGDLQAGGVVCADPGSYLFWDSVHPTTAAHRVLGNAFAAAVAEPVPEPASLTLLSLGIGLAVAARRRRAS